jgi:putative spermidine/putrescine transport system permease protein
MTLRVRGVALNGAVALVAIFLTLPTLVFVPLSFTENQILRWPPKGFSLQWYHQLISDPVWSDAVKTSLKIALLTVALATVLGTLCALGLVRGRFRGKGAVNALVMSPIIVPIVVLAIGVYFVFVRLRLVGTTQGLVIADSVLALPLVIVSVSNSLRGVDRDLELAAQNLGAGPLRTFLRVTLPLILPGVVVGALFAFVTSWDELVIAIFLTSPTVKTLPVVMFTEIKQDVRPTIAAAATVLIAVTMLVLAATLLIRRKEGVRA